MVALERLQFSGSDQIILFQCIPVESSIRHHFMHLMGIEGEEGIGLDEL